MELWEFHVHLSENFGKVSVWNWGKYGPIWTKFCRELRGSNTNSCTKFDSEILRYIGFKAVCLRILIHPYMGTRPKPGPIS